MLEMSDADLLNNRISSHKDLDKEDAAWLEKTISPKSSSDETAYFLSGTNKKVLLASVRE